jgi:hypothetical protein
MSEHDKTGEHCCKRFFRARVMGSPTGEPLELTEENRSHTLRSALPRLAGAEAAMLSERGSIVVTAGGVPRGAVDPDRTTLGDLDAMFRAAGQNDEELSVNMGVNAHGGAVRCGRHPGPAYWTGF